MKKIILLMIVWMIFFLIQNSLAMECGNPQAVHRGSSGPGYQSTPDPQETENPGLPDFIVKKVILKNGQGKETYSYDYHKKIRIEATLKNIGEADWAGNQDHMHVMFFLSQGYKEDRHSDWVPIGKERIKKGHLNVGEEKKERITLSLYDYFLDGYIRPHQVYNIVACADRNKQRHNGDGHVPEEHKSNNCSTEAVFEVIDTQAPPENSSLNLVLNDAYLKGGATQAYPGERLLIKARVTKTPHRNVTSDPRIDYYLDNQFLEEDSIPSGVFNLSNENWEECYFTVPDSIGYHTLSVCVDPHNQISETNENDNCLEVPLQIKERVSSPASVLLMLLNN